MTEHEPERVVMVDVYGENEPIDGAVSLDEYRGEPEKNPKLIIGSTYTMIESDYTLPEPLVCQKRSPLTI